MSKKHKSQHQNFNNTSLSHTPSADHALEYKIIKHDLIRVVVLNIIYLAGITALYMSEQKTHLLTRFFEKTLHF